MELGRRRRSQADLRPRTRQRHRHATRAVGAPPGADGAGARHTAVEPAWGLGLAGPSSSTSSSSSPNPSPNPSAGPSSSPSPNPNPRPNPGQARHAAVEPDRALAACCGRSHDHGLPHGPGQPARQRLWPVAGSHKLAAATTASVMPMPGAGRPCVMLFRDCGWAGCRQGAAALSPGRAAPPPCLRYYAAMTVRPFQPLRSLGARAWRPVLA